MKVLIVSNCTGGGHNAAAFALKEEFRKLGHEAVMMDPFELKGRTSGKITSTIVNKTYTKAVQKVPHIFGFFYNLGEIFNKHATDGPVMTPVYYWNYNMAERLYRFITKSGFDAVITCHPYPGEMLHAIRQRGHFLPPTFWVSTDYHCIPLTREGNQDNYVIASPDLIDEYVSLGVPEHHLYPIGIPVKKEFRTKLTQEQARTALGLEQDKKYIMISGGAVGSGKILEGVTLLAGRYLIDSNVRIIAICGDNGFLYREIKRLFPGKVILMEHTDRMAEYMIASDIIITKPGGLSSTEASSLGKPLIFISPIPGGLEASNVKFFQEHGMALYAKSINRDLLKCVDQLKDPTVAEQIIENQRKYINKNAATDIVRLVEKKVECGSYLRKDMTRSKKAMDRRLEMQRKEAEKEARRRMDAEKARMKEEKAAVKAAEKERKTAEKEKKNAAKKAAAAAKKAAAAAKKAASRKKNDEKE